VCDREIKGQPLALIYVGPPEANGGCTFFRFLFCDDDCLDVRLKKANHPAVVYGVRERRKALGIE